MVALPIVDQRLRSLLPWISAEHCSLIRTTVFTVPVTATTAGLALGTYTFFARAENNIGVQSLAARVSVTVQQKKGKPLTAEPPGPGTGLPGLTDAELRPIFHEAVARWRRERAIEATRRKRPDLGARRKDDERKAPPAGE